MTCMANCTIWPLMRTSAYHHWGIKPDDAGRKVAEAQLKSVAKCLNGQLNGKSWLVGERLTLADIVVFNSLMIAFTFVFDGGFLKAMPNLAGWFAKMSKLPVVARTAGYVKMQGGVQKPAPVAAKPAK